MADRDIAAHENADREAEKLDLEMHARLEAGLLDGEVRSTSQSMTQTQKGPKTPSLWQALKRFFH